MIKLSIKTKQIFILLPIFGIVDFVLFYIIASYLYPGGSQYNKQAVGFSWFHNYWCNLLNQTAINGEPNSAKTIAMFGMIILCISLIIFWLIFPILTNLSSKLKIFIQLSGAIAMLIAQLLFTNIDHDLVTNLASFFGLLATIGTIIGLNKKKWKMLVFYGVFNLLLIGINNIFYYSNQLIYYLPFVQKISFASYLIWVCIIQIKIFMELKKNNAHSLFDKEN